MILKWHQFIKENLLIDSYLKSYPTGGNLHLVLDNDNYDNYSIEFCLIQCIEQNDNKGKDICKHLLTLSISDRIRLCKNIPHWELDNFDYEYTKVFGTISKNDFVIYEGDEYPIIFIIGDIINNEACPKNTNIWYNIEDCTKIIIE